MTVTATSEHEDARLSPFEAMYAFCWVTVAILLPCDISLFFGALSALALGLRWESQRQPQLDRDTEMRLLAKQEERLDRQLAALDEEIYALPEG